MRRNFITLLCLLTLVFGVSVKSHAVITTNLYFPHVASNANWETEIGIINTGVTLLSGVLHAYDSNGDEVENQQLVLSSNARVELSVGNDFDHPDQIRYIIFEHATDTSCRGYEKFYTAGQRVAIPAVEDVNGSTIYISHIASDVNWWTGLALVNTTDEDKNLTFTLSDGSQHPLALSAGQHWSGTIASSFPVVDAAAIQSATISNASGIIGLELFGSSANSGNHYLSGILLTDQTTNTLYYPHVASDDNWWTGIVSYNPSTIASTITITPYTASGQALSTTNLEVAAKSKYIGAVAGLNLPQDTAWFKVDSSSPITGFELFGQKDGSQLAGYSAVNIQTKQGTFLKTDHQGWTGIAFVNTEDQPATVTLTALNDRGTTIASSSIQLVGNGKQVSLAETFFAPTDISNASYIKFSSDKELVGFQLNSSADSMMLDGLPGIAATVCTDSDGDGYYAEGGACGVMDCNDSDSDVHPGVSEVYDFIDNNCDGTTDEGFVLVTWYADRDYDGYGDASDSLEAVFEPENYVEDDTDCDDTDYYTHPGATEVLGDGIDQDCDGFDPPTLGKVKIAASGLSLADQGASYGVSPWVAVLDNDTELMWEVKTIDDGFQDQNWTYTWYNSTGVNDGGFAGTANGGTCIDDVNCDTEKYVAAVNAAALAGYSDWRLPTTDELKTIFVGYNRPTIDTEYFPNTLTGYWTADTSSSWNDYAVWAHFGIASSFIKVKNYSFSVRLVRGGNG